jgi:nitrogen fixation protein FixH
MTELTGRHVFAICAGAFGVIIAVNVLLAVKAVSTFPGLEVKSSYIAGQDFDDRKEAQIALGWQVDSHWDPATREILLTFTGPDGALVRVEELRVLVGRPTEAQEDRFPTFRRVASGYAAAADLSPGRWMLKVEAVALDGTRFEQRRDLMVKG